MNRQPNYFQSPSESRIEAPSRIKPNWVRRNVMLAILISTLVSISFSLAMLVFGWFLGVRVGAATFVVDPTDQLYIDLGEEKAKTIHICNYGFVFAFSSAVIGFAIPWGYVIWNLIRRKRH